MGRLQELLDEHRAAGSRPGSRFELDGRSIDLGRLALFLATILQQRDRGAELWVKGGPAGTSRALTRYYLLAGLIDRAGDPTFVFAMLGEQRDRFRDPRNEIARMLVEADEGVWEAYLGRFRVEPGDVRFESDEEWDGLQSYPRAGGWPGLTAEAYQQEMTAAEGDALKATGMPTACVEENGYSVESHDYSVESRDSALLELTRLRPCEGWVYRDDDGAERTIRVAIIEKALRSNGSIDRAVLVGHVDWLLQRVQRPESGRLVGALMARAVAERIGPTSLQELRKGRVRGYERRNPTGRVSWVREHESGREAARQEQPEERRPAVTVSRQPSKRAAVPKEVPSAYRRAWMTAEQLGGAEWHEGLGAVIPKNPERVHALWRTLRQKASKLIGPIEEGPVEESAGWHNGATTASDLHELAADVAPDLKSLTERIASDAQGMASFGPGGQFLVKSGDSLAAKVKRGREGHGLPEDEVVRGIPDAVRSSVIVDRIQDIGAAARALQKEAEARGLSWTMDNKWDEEKAPQSGYLAVHAMVMMKDTKGREIRGEVQIHLKAINNGTEESTKELAHRYYKAPAEYGGLRGYASELLFASALMGVV